jgi:HD-GYP domain-containing protein (c-di-GMP phosphodiesterase class II)
MIRDHGRLAHAARLLRSLATVRQAALLYPPTHPERRRHALELVTAGEALCAATVDGVPTIFVERGSYYLGLELLPHATLELGALASALEAAGIESLTLAGTVAPREVDVLLAILDRSAPLQQELGGLRLNAVRPGLRDEPDWMRRLGDLRRAYAAGVTTLRNAAAQVAAGEPIDLTAALGVVELLHEEVVRDPGYGLLLSAVKSYDEYTYFHMINVCLLSVALGQSIGLRRDQIMVLGLGGLLHDIGKVFVPQDILRGTGRLDEEQWRLVQRHPVDGAAMMLATGDGLYHPATAILLEHHAAYDGSGYPRLHQHGPSVPSRLVAVADCFDAVTSKRSYREPLDRHRALALLATAAGEGLDPNAVVAFQALLGRFPVGSLVRLSDGEVALVVAQHDRLVDRPRVLLLFDASDTPRPVEERDLALDAPTGPRVVTRVDPSSLGIDLARFVISGQLEPSVAGPPGGLVHEPSPGEVTPAGYVDDHAHQHPHPHPNAEARPDPDVAPPIVGAATGAGAGRG